MSRPDEQNYSMKNQNYSMKKPHSMTPLHLSLRARFVCLPVIAALISALIAFGGVAQGQTTLLNGGFEASSSLPSGWTEQKLVGNRSWKVQTGSGDFSIWDASVNYPATAHSGTYNACLFSNVKGTKTRLISPAFDSTGYLNLSLSFWHTQVPFGGAGGQDNLRILYSSDGGTSWSERAYYDYNIGSWTQRTIFLGQPSANSRIAFEAVANYGAGVCLDDISVTADTAASLPEVSVTATDAAASETGPDAGSWTIARTGVTTGALTVNLGLSGTATQGSDYSISDTGSVTIPAGQSLVQVTLTPVDDSVYDEFDETAVLTLTPNAAYGLGGAYEDTITIADNDDADVRVLVIGSSRDSNQSSKISNGGSSPFDGEAVRDQLHNILSGAGLGGVNVKYINRSAEGYSTDVFSLAQWFHYPYPENIETTTRWPYLSNQNGAGDFAWDYVVLIGDPYTMEKMPGVYAQGVAAVGQEVAKGYTPENPVETILLMPWSVGGSTTLVDHYKDVVYRAGRTGGYKVAPAALAWKDDGYPSDATRCAYISAASIYSRIWGQSSSNSTYNYNNTLANSVNAIVTSNVGVGDYAGKLNFQNPFLMLGDPRRQVLYGEKGTSTEQDYVSGAAAAMNRCRVSYSTSGFRDSYTDNQPGWTGDNLPIAWNHGRKFAETNKEYVTNTDYWQLGIGFTYQWNTWSLPVATANDQQISNMFSSEIDLAGFMIEASNAANGQDDSARCIPWRFMWALIHQEYPALRPLRDGSGPHVNTDLREAVGTYMYTMYSGRCPLDPMPNPMTTKWFAQKVGYETAWRMGNCSSRAPGFKVMPSSTNKKTIASGTTETMSVVFILPPKNDVTVTVASSRATAAIVGPKTLIFTPANYNVPQQVTVAALPGTVTSEDFNVTFATSSSDEAYDSLSDSWAYTATRSTTPTSLTQVDNGITNVTAFQNTPLTINLNAAGSNATNTILLGAVNGSVIWTSDGVIEYTPNNGYLGNDTITYAATLDGTQTIGCINITVVVPNGQVNALVGDASASEEGADTGTFVINRVGDISGSLNVLFAMSGTATFGSDYTLSHNSPVTIPDGEASVTITLTPVDDSVFGERYESAVLSLVEDAAYPIGTASSTITITDNDNNAPLANAGTDQNIAWSGVTTVPGLHFGELAGNMDETTANPESVILVDVSSKTEDTIATNTTEIFTGQIYDADGQISFTEHIDDKARIWIDGVLVINNDAWKTRTFTANLNLAPGWHDIEIRISNGSGGSGPVNGEIGIGYDPAGGTTWQTLIDPGDGSFLKANSGVAGGNATLDGSATDVNSDPLSYSWSVVSGPGNVTFGDASSPDSTAHFDALGTYVLQLTVDDGFDQDTDEVTIIVNSALPSIYATWAGGSFTDNFNDTDPTNNGDGDSNGNMMEFAFGTDPTISDGGPLVLNGPNGTTNGQPVLIEGADDAMEFYFVRRKEDHGTSGSVSYTVQFSTDLTSFTNSVVTPTVVANSTTNYEVVKVAFPTGSRFGRLEVDFVP